MPGSGSPGIRPVLQPAADIGGLAGPVPAKAYSQADVTMTWMPGKRARRPGGERGGQLEPHRRAVLPVPETEPAKPFAEPAGADPAADSTVQRGPCPFRLGRPGSCRPGRLARWDLRWKRCRHALMPIERKATSHT
jgi:hypothetical protein